MKACEGEVESSNKPGRMVPGRERCTCKSPVAAEELTMPGGRRAIPGEVRLWGGDHSCWLVADGGDFYP